MCTSLTSTYPHGSLPFKPNYTHFTIWWQFKYCLCLLIQWHYRTHLFIVYGCEIELHTKYSWSSCSANALCWNTNGLITSNRLNLFFQTFVVSCNSCIFHSPNIYLYVEAFASPKSNYRSFWGADADLSNPK